MSSFYLKYFNKTNCNINIDFHIISPNDSDLNLAIFQSDTSMDKEISAKVKSPFLQL